MYIYSRKKPKRHKGRKSTSTPYFEGWEKQHDILLRCWDGDWNPHENYGVDSDDKISGQHLIETSQLLMSIWKSMSNINNIELRRLIGLCYDHVHECPADEQYTFMNKVKRMQSMVGSSRYHDEVEEMCEWYLDLIDVDYD